MYAKELMNLDEEQAKFEAERLLEDFDKDFHSTRLEKLRDIFPRYVALYTKFIFKPSIAVRGINPSLFSCRRVEDLNDIEEEKRVFSLKGLHNKNAYISYPEPLYHHYLVKDFMAITSEDFIEEKLMGWNDCFIQSPKQGGMEFLESKAESIDRENRNSYCLDLIKKSKLISRKLEYLIRPKLIIFAGTDAAWQSRRWNKGDTLKVMKRNEEKTSWGGKAIVVKHFSYPCKTRAEEIKMLIRKLGIDS